MTAGPIRCRLSPPAGPAVADARPAARRARVRRLVPRRPHVVLLRQARSRSRGGAAAAAAAASCGRVPCLSLSRAEPASPPRPNPPQHDADDRRPAVPRRGGERPPHRPLCLAAFCRRARAHACLTVTATADVLSFQLPSARSWRCWRAAATPLLPPRGALVRGRRRSPASRCRRASGGSTCKRSGRGTRRKAPSRRRARSARGSVAAAALVACGRLSGAVTPPRES